MEHRISSVTNYLKNHLWNGCAEPITLSKYVNSIINEQTNFFRTEDFGDKYAKNVPVEGASPSDYLNKIISLSEKHHVIAGIRFVNLESSKPFVEIYPGFDIFEKENYRSLQMKLLEEYQIFNCTQLRVRLSKSFLKNASAKMSNLVVDMDWVYGSRLDFASIERPEKPDLELMRVRPEKYYQTFISELEEFHVSHPDLRTHVRPSSLDDLSKSFEQGLFFVILVNNDVAGIMAAQISSFFGVKSLELIEEFLFKNQRGKGLGKLVQSLFLEEVGKGQLRDLPVFGSIHQLNKASLSIALANGRRVVASDIFVRMESK